MSTIKTDTIVAVSTNGDLSLDGLGTGGVSIASTLKMTKGGDISSASPLVIDVDGNYFDVTGTTNFSAMTVESGNFFMLQFDGALTITHGSGIELPGAANLTTATGDRLICYATAANTVEVMSVETEAAVAAGGLVFIEKFTASAASWDFEANLSDTYDTYMIVYRVQPATDSTQLYLTVSIASTYATGDYEYAASHQSTTSIVGVYSDSGSQILPQSDRNEGSAAGESCQGIIWFHEPSSTAHYTMFHGNGFMRDDGGNGYRTNFGGMYEGSAAAVDGVRLTMSSGNITGEASLYGIVRV